MDLIFWTTLYIMLTILTLICFWWAWTPRNVLIRYGTITCSIKCSVHYPTVNGDLYIISTPSLKWFWSGMVRCIIKPVLWSQEVAGKVAFDHQCFFNVFISDFIKKLNSCKSGVRTVDVGIRTFSQWTLSQRTFSQYLQGGTFSQHSNFSSYICMYIVIFLSLCMIC